MACSLVHSISSEASIRPRLNTAEHAAQTSFFRRGTVQASIRPRLNTAEHSLPVVSIALLAVASIRPRLNTAEHSLPYRSSVSVVPCFNKTAAQHRGAQNGAWVDINPDQMLQ